MFHFVIFGTPFAEEGLSPSLRKLQRRKKSLGSTSSVSTLDLNYFAGHLPRSFTHAYELSLRTPSPLQPRLFCCIHPGPNVRILPGFDPRAKRNTLRGHHHAGLQW